MFTLLYRLAFRVGTKSLSAKKVDSWMRSYIFSYIYSLVKQDMSYDKFFKWTKKNITLTDWIYNKTKKTHG